MKFEIFASRMTMQKIIVYLFVLYFFLLLSGTAAEALFSQNPESKRATHWYFGDGAGLDFSSGSPIAVIDGALHTPEGCASISDLSGNLLFYTDGDTVWNQNHIPMPNGTGLLGCSLGSSIQGALIMPQPQSNNLYYVFTTDCGENLGFNGLRYSIIDMNLNGGLGDIVFTQKNIQLMTPVDECLTGVQVCDSVSWIITHQSNTSNFYCYKLTQNGITIFPVINVIGQPYILYSSCAKFSNSGQKFALVYGGVNSFLELYDFDINTGKLSNLKTLIANGGESSIEFSTNENYLYVPSNGNMLHQFDISSNNSSLINSSYTLIYDSFDNSSFLAVQNAIDNKIYISAMNKDSISVIANSNSLGLSCNLNYLSVSLNGRYSQLGLPNFSTNYFAPNSLENCSEIIYIPNVFTPNDDGVNDYFNIEVSNYSEIHYSIYNRWGNEIFNSVAQPITSSVITLWDGKIKGENASAGVYFYLVNLKKAGGENKTEKGFIQLLH